ncbi:MAG: hypothetical protein H7338_19795 [Candidatus Sericytochromatia bacterium]|nr:hypothetical protein [Candidatus Sericytochromatia bacterium]
MAITPISGRITPFPDAALGLDFAPNPATGGAEEPFALLLAEAIALSSSQHVAGVLKDNPNLPILRVTQSFIGDIAAGAGQGDVAALDFAAFVAQSIDLEKEEQDELVHREKIKAVLKYELNLKSKLATVFNLPVGAQQEVLAAVHRKEAQIADWRQRQTAFYI